MIGAVLAPLVGVLTGRPNSTHITVIPFRLDNGGGVQGVPYTTIAFDMNNASGLYASIPRVIDISFDVAYGGITPTPVEINFTLANS